MSEAPTFVLVYGGLVLPLEGSDVQHVNFVTISTVNNMTYAICKSPAGIISTIDPGMLHPIDARARSTAGGEP
jgi:hypothetical protein